jgi:DnaJ-class molecular chaperone
MSADRRVASPSGTGGAEPDVCETCDGDGYTESWNDDQSDVVVTLCTDCGPGPGDFDA